MADANVDLNDVLGSILIGTWLNAMLYMLEITQVIHYFQNYSNDRPIFKIAVATVFILDTVCTVAACASAYLYSVVHWGDRAYLAQQYWPIPMYIVTTGTCGAIVQFFMLSRYWILTKRKAVASVIIIGIIVTWGGSIYSASKLATFSDYSQRKTVFVSATIWFLTSAVTDLAIAIALIITLSSSHVEHKSAKRLVRRISILSLKTGTLSAVTAVAGLIVYMCNPEGNVCLIFGYCIGRVYALTLLYSLNIRKSLNFHDTMLDAESIVLTRSNGVHQRITVEVISVSSQKSIHSAGECISSNPSPTQPCMAAEISKPPLVFDWAENHCGDWK